MFPFFSHPAEGSGNVGDIFFIGDGDEKSPPDGGDDQREKSSLSYLEKSRALAFLGMRLMGS